MHLIPPILTYVRLCAMCSLSIYPPLFEPTSAKISALDEHCMHTNPFNYPFFKGGHFSGNYQVVILRDQAHTLWSFGADALPLGSPGGLKGETRPGDAHPYLASF